MEDVPPDLSDVGEDPDPEHDDHSRGKLAADTQLVAEVDDRRRDHDVGEERDDEDLVVEDALEIGTQRAEHGVQGCHDGDRQVRGESGRHVGREDQPPADAQEKSQCRDHVPLSPIWVRLPLSSGATSAERSRGAGADGNDIVPPLRTSKRNPRVSLSAYHFPPTALASRFAGRVSGSPMTSSTYGGLIGWAFTRMPMPTLRKALRTVSRWPLTLIASAPAAQSASVRRVRSASWTSWPPAVSGALFTVTSTPGPLTAPNPVRTPSRSRRDCAARSSVARSCVRARSATTRDPSRSSCAWRSLSPWRRRLICSTRLSRLASEAEALRL